jgi:hypothetical protein
MERKPILTDYHHTLDTIKSCTNDAQLQVAKRMVTQFSITHQPNVAAPLFVGDLHYVVQEKGKELLNQKEQNNDNTGGDATCVNQCQS